MPLRRDGQTRKRWRYVGVFGEELMLCAARAEVGPLAQSFWVLWDREGRRHDAHTTLRPGSREVRMRRALSRDRLAGAARQPAARRGRRRSNRSAPAAAGWGWTRKRAGVPIEGTVEVPGRRWEIVGPRRRRRVGRLPPAPHQLALVGRGRPRRRRPRPRLEPGRGRQRPGREQRAGDLGRRRAHRAGAGRASDGIDAIDFARRRSASTSPPSPTTPATRTSSSSAPATATASAASPAPSAASSWPRASA